MFGTDARIIESGRNRVNVLRLAVVVLKDVAEAAVKDAGPPCDRLEACSPDVGPRPPASAPTISTAGPR